MPPAAGRFLRQLGQAASLSLWRRPQSRLELAGFGSFLVACGLALLAFMAQDYQGTDTPAQFYGDGLEAHTSYFLFALVAAWLCALALLRPALWLSLATLAVLVGIPWTAVSLAVNDWLADGDTLQLGAWRILVAMAGFTAIFRLVGFASSGTHAPRRLLASLLFVLVLAGPWYWQQSAWFWYPPEDVEADVQQAQEAVVPSPAPAKAAATFDTELVPYRQAAMVEQAVKAMRAQTPGKIDLFTVGFAGDGSEKVFRNEVEYFDELMARRFNAYGRTLSLINAPDTLDRVPLATLTNLRAALAGVAARMDTREDVLALFLTSHGSEDHLLYVGMDPLPLRQIHPKELRAAFDDAGIRWRVIVVSACYSGGFVDALRDEHTLVIAAARADRTSFGCGNDSSITWFGKAFLTDALNRTIDFEHGFDLASRQIRQWELAQGESPSVPQMAGGWAIRQQLAAWRKTVPAAPAVPFLPR